MGRPACLRHVFSGASGGAYPQGAHLVVQRGAGHAQQCGSPVPSRYLSSGHAQYRRDILFFQIAGAGQAGEHFAHHPFRAARFAGFPRPGLFIRTFRIFRRRRAKASAVEREVQSAVMRQNHGSLHDIAQFADIPRPGMGAQFQGVRRVDAGHGAPA